MKEADAYKLYDYAVYMNTKVVPEISRIAEEYRRIMSSPANAEATLRANGFDFDLLTKNGFYQDKEGRWVQKALGKKATDKERENALAGYQEVHNAVVNFTSSLRQTRGGSAEIAENIMQKRGSRLRLLPMSRMKPIPNLSMRTGSVIIPEQTTGWPVEIIPVRENSPRQRRSKLS